MSAVFTKILLWLAALLPLSIISILTFKKARTSEQKIRMLVIYAFYCFFQNYALADAFNKAAASNLQAEPFVLGIIGAFCICAILEKIDSSPKTYFALILSMLVAGFGSTVASQLIIKYCNCTNMETLFYITPLCIGVALPVIVPIGAKYLKNKWGKDAPND